MSDAIVDDCSTGIHIPSLKHMPTVPVVVVGNEGRVLIGAWGYLIRKLSFIC